MPCDGSFTLFWCISALHHAWFRSSSGGVMSRSKISLDLPCRLHPHTWRKYERRQGFIFSEPSKTLGSTIVTLHISKTFQLVACKSSNQSRIRMLKLRVEVVFTARTFAVRAFSVHFYWFPARTFLRTEIFWLSNVVFKQTLFERMADLRFFVWSFRFTWTHPDRVHNTILAAATCRTALKIEFVDVHFYRVMIIMPKDHLRQVQYMCIWNDGELVDTSTFL